MDLYDKGNLLQCYQPSSANSLAIRLSQPPVQQYSIVPSAGANGTVSPNITQVANLGSNVSFTAAPSAGYVVDQWLVDGVLVQIGGTIYQLTNITANHAIEVRFKVGLIFPVAKGPYNIVALPGNTQVVLNWVAPTNTGYTVTYGPTSGTVFTTPGCTTMGAPPSTSCTISGLTNNTAYTFAVTTTTAMDGVKETGPATLSSSVIPSSGLVVSPSTLLLSGIGGGTTRTITVTNTSPNPITLDFVSSPLPALPGDATVDISTSIA